MLLISYQVFALRDGQPVLITWEEGMELTWRNKQDNADLLKIHNLIYIVMWHAVYINSVLTLYFLYCTMNVF